MNYRKTYISIIIKAKSENRKKNNGQYYENHHILPKSLFPLWEKKPINFVLLTAREHFFCHQLLVKIYPKKPMIYALYRLCNDKQNNYCKIGSREYEKIKLKFIKWNKRTNIEKYGEEKAKLLSEKQSLRLKGKKQSKEQIFNRINSLGFKKGIIKAAEQRRGTHRSEKDKENISKKMSIYRQQKLNNEINEIICLDTKKIWKNIRELCKELKSINYDSNIARSIRCKSSYHSKYYAFLKDYPTDESQQEELKKRINNSKKGPKTKRFWFTNGVMNINAEECPIGYKRGRTNEVGLKHKKHIFLNGKSSKYDELKFMSIETGEIMSGKQIRDSRKFSVYEILNVSLGKKKRHKNLTWEILKD